MKFNATSCSCEAREKPDDKLVKLKKIKIFDAVVPHSSFCISFFSWFYYYYFVGWAMCAMCDDMKIDLSQMMMLLASRFSFALWCHILWLMFHFLFIFLLIYFSFMVLLVASDGIISIWKPKRLLNMVFSLLFNLIHNDSKRNKNWKKL